MVNRILVGVTFDRLSVLQPRLPDTIDEMSTSTHVSAYFRTPEPNGMILYLGNPKGTKLRKTKTVSSSFVHTNTFLNGKSVKLDTQKKWMEYLEMLMSCLQ